MLTRRTPMIPNLRNIRGVGERLIKSFWHKIHATANRLFMRHLTYAHEKLRNDGWYKHIGLEFINVLVTGFVISIALIPFMDWQPELSLSYGVIPWLLVQFVTYVKREWKRTQ